MAQTEPAAPRRASPKKERLVARLTAEQKQLFQRAADLEGRSLTDFAVAALQDAARRTLTNHQVIELGMRDSQRLAEALLNPPEPTAQLREALARHRDLIGS